MTMQPTTSGGPASMPNAGQGCSSLIEINSNLTSIRAVTFSANGEHIISGGIEGIRVWRVEDGIQVASFTNLEHVRCLAVSKDGRWIAAGTYRELTVLDAKTYEHVFVHQEAYITGVDFSPDSVRLVTASLNNTTAVWDVEARQRVFGPLQHEDIVISAKYAPQGTRFTTATPNAVHVYDSNNGRLLVRLPLKVTPWYNHGLLWESNERLTVLSNNAIKQIDPSTHSLILELPVSDTTNSSCIALPRHGGYIAYAINHTLTVSDMSTHSRLALIQYPQSILSIACSPDDRCLVVAGEGGKITVYNMAGVNDSIPLPRLHPTFQEPDIQIDDAVLDAWKCDRLENAEALLNAAITSSQEPNHHALAGRALVRTRLHEWDAALSDAEQSIKARPSVASYIAKSIALVGKGKKEDGYRACDIAFERFHSTHVSFILLIKAVIMFMAGDRLGAISRVDDLIATVRFNSICCVVQAYMYFSLGNSHLDRRDFERAIEAFERAIAQMRRHTSRPLSVISLVSGWKFDDLGVTIQKQLCEALYATGRTKEAGELLLEMLRTVEEEIHKSVPIIAWSSDFMQRYLSAPESSRDASSEGHDDVPLQPPFSTLLAREWTKLKLTSGSWKDVLSAAESFTVPKFTIYRVICERLETLDRTTDGTECFHQMIRGLGREQNSFAEQAEWIRNFKQHLSKKLECRGDGAAGAQRHDEAISEYSAALSLDLASPQEILIKRSKVYLTRDLWKDALNDANEVIRLDPSSPWGYERKHAALHRAGDYDHAIDAFEKMLSKMVDSPAPEVQKRRDNYVSPSDTRMAICKIVQDAVHNLPRVLINTTTGRLYDKAKQTSAFESQSVFKEMISSMTMSIDYTRIEQEVMEYYRYATFSHRWEENEPPFERVIHVVVYDLEESPTHDKLQMFCKIVRDAGLNWAWSDTCCINKANHFMLQEALVAMFKWYEGSAVTIVYLRDVHSPGRRGDLVRSVWNGRAWTFQEYHASKVVRFYTADWKPYLNLDIPNHKESPEIISEMEEATGVPAQTLKALQPGLDDIRDKLCLASRRKTTLIEDTAYSLLGVFSVSLPIMYGERDKALGRLLAQLLTCSGDTSILAWTGKSGSFNSCLPANITAFDQPSTTHIPQAISNAEMDKITSRLHISPPNLSPAQMLYDRLGQLPTPVFIDKRMKLPCMIFKLGKLSPSRNTSERAFRAQTTALGVVEIRTNEDISRLDSLYLVHPWIDFLLDRHPVGSGAAITPEGSIDDRSSSISEVSPPLWASNTMSTTLTRRTRGSQLVARFSLSLRGRSGTADMMPPQDAMSLLPPSSMSQIDKRMLVLQFVARLRQPFGALMFTPTRQHVPEYRRVAAESSIMVQVQEDAPWNVLIDSARMLDVL